MNRLPEYFNTTHLKGPKLQKEVRNARSQDKLILDYFKRKRTGTPSQIYRLRVSIGLDYNIPLTSVRRSVTTLTKKTYLIKERKKRIGLYGKPEHFWTINDCQISLL